MVWALAVAAVMVAGAVALAETALLPEVEGWTNGEVQVIHLDTVSGNQGFWVRRNYVSSRNIGITANLIGGKGPGSLYLSAPGTDALDGPIGSGAGYEAVTVGEHRGILEHDPTIGYSLSLQMEGAVLTLECRAFDLQKEDLLAEAEHLLSELKR